MEIDSILPHMAKAGGLVCLGCMLAGSYIIGRTSKVEINLGAVNLYVTTSEAQTALQHIDDQVKSVELPPTPQEISGKLKVMPKLQEKRNGKNN